MSKKIGNSKYMTLEQLNRILNDFNCQGVTGKDYDVIKDELQSRLWELQSKKDENNFERMIKEREEYENSL